MFRLLQSLVSGLRKKCSNTAARPPNPTSRRLKRFRPELECLETRLVPTVAWQGGAVLTAPDVQPLYLGSDWKTVSADSQQATYLNGFVQNIVQSSYLPMLGNAGYGAAGQTQVPIGKGTYETGQTDPVTLNKSQNLQDSQIQTYIQNEITNKTLKSPNSQNLYVVYVEDNVAVQTSFGTSNNPSGFFGYHTAFPGKNASGQATDIHYAVICYPGGTVGNPSNNAGNLPWLSINGVLTETTTHELAEAATDPDIGNQGKALGWYDNQAFNGKGAEVGDIVNGETVYLNGYAVQRIADMNDQPMIPAGATAENPVSFVLSNGTLQVHSGSVVTTIATGVASVSDQGIADDGQAMVDYVMKTGGTAYEYHVYQNHSVSLGSGIKIAEAGNGVSYLFTTNSVGAGGLEEYKDGNFANGNTSSLTTLEFTASTNPVVALSAGTDLHGVNMVGVRYSNGAAWGVSDSPWNAGSDWFFIANHVSALSGGLEGITTYVTTSGSVYLFLEGSGNTPSINVLIS